MSDVSIKDKRLIYHLTCIDNFESIVRQGLCPRSYAPSFVDVAEQHIIEQRNTYGLNEYVPFHFFAKNPFDGKVQSNHPDKKYILLAIERTVAKSKGFKILPMHPVHFFNNYRSTFPNCFKNNEIIPMDYDEGMNAIEWETMDKRDYYDEHCKMVCMAECLYKPVNKSIPISAFKYIYVPDDEIYNIVVALLKKYGYSIHDFVITTNSRMFSSRRGSNDSDNDWGYIEF